MRKTVAALLSIALMMSCQTQSDKDKQIMETAKKLAQSFVIVDTHIDYPLKQERKFLNPELLDTTRNFDIPRAMKGGLNLPFFALYISPHHQLDGTSYQAAEDVFAVIDKMKDHYSDSLQLVTSASDFRKNFETNPRKVYMGLGMENGAPIEKDLSRIKMYYDRGVRYLTLCHGKDNQICDSSYDSTQTWQGLSPFGHQVVAEMNRVGMMIDVAHVSDSTFYQVVRESRVPVIATHSACRHFTPGFERNLSDDMIRKLAQSGGLIMINFGSTFVRPEINAQAQAGERYAEEERVKRGLTEGDPEYRALVKAYREAHPLPLADVSDVARNIVYAVKLAGIDRVGIGSDFEGLGNTLPTGLTDVSMYPNLLAELLKAGLSEQDIKKICGENFLNYWEKVQEAAG